GWWPSTWSASPSASASIPTCRSGPPASTCSPAAERNSADPFHDRRVATATAGGRGTHGTKGCAAVGGRRWGGPGGLPAPARTSAPTEVAVNLKKVVTWLIVAFVIFYVIQQPENSPDMVRSARHPLVFVG